MPEDFTDALRDLSGSSDEDIYGDGDDEGSLSRGEGQAPGDEQQLQRVMLNPAPDANAQELRKALGLAQLAFSDTRAKLLDLMKRYNALASEAQRSRKGGPGHKSKAPSTLEQSISDATKKYCLFYHLWVPPLLFPVKAQPDIDPCDLSHWQSSEGQIIAEQVELYQMLPSELHKSLTTFPDSRRLWLRSARNIVKNIKDVSANLFSELDIKATLFSGDKSLKALDPMLSGLLKKPGDSQYTQLSPILFIACVLMFEKAILSNKKRGGPKGQGERMGVQTVTEGLIASTATIVRYLLSHDCEFSVKGEATSIPYQKDFKFYLKLLLHPDRRRWALDVIEFFNIGVVGTKPSATQSENNPTGVSSHVHSWEDELLSEIGNNFEPPTFPSHPPSEPLVSNPRPFSVATDTRAAAAAVVHKPRPAPPSPGHGAPSESDSDAEPAMPTLVVITERPRPRPLMKRPEPT
ncbi:hypothetical protein EV363DRAFT_1455964 [Boletus edulis]|nr:hypothetical protein EV363DRAFT_1455964 [Boletus edulis]